MSNRCLCEIARAIKDHINANESCLIIAQAVLNLAQQAKEIFLSSNINEKQQLLKFVFSNLRMDGEKLDLELKEPFSVFAKMGDQPEWLPEQDYLRTFVYDSFAPRRIQEFIGSAC